MLNVNVLLKELQALDPSFDRDIAQLRADAKEKGICFCDYILSLGQFEESSLRSAFAKAYSLDPAPELPSNISGLTLKYLPLPMAKAQNIAVFEDSLDEIRIATCNPANDDVLDLVAKKLKKKVQIYFAFEYEVKKSLKVPSEDIEEKFEALKAGALENITSIESLKSSSKLLDAILVSSLQHNASDIHIEPHEGRLLIRFRIDGELKDIIDLPLELSDVITSRIKVLAELRTDEHFKPQDGRFRLELSDKSTVTVRVSIMPVYDGEKIVMRILQGKDQKVELMDLGFSQRNQEIIYDNIIKSHGMLLITGPTGSGKTTTLYTLLKILNKPKVNIMTIEDPIEYKLDRINQIQVNAAAGLTFASGLRSILRQDPDIIMVGEIRDEETASIAVNAALTGHLVLATLHTNSAIDSIPRLMEMGVEPYLVASTVNIAGAQRLVRQLCDKCKKPIKYNPELLSAVNLEESEFTKQLSQYIKSYIPVGTTIYQAQGCDMCSKTGYSGRLAIAEVLEITDDIKEMIYAKKSPIEIEDTARPLGFITMLEDGLVKVRDGDTTLEEVIRITKE